LHCTYDEIREARSPPLPLWERVGVRVRSGARRPFILRGGSTRPMIVSSCSTQGDRQMLDTQAQEAVGDLRLPEPAVEPIDEFIDVFLEPMRANGTVVGPKQKAFQVADHHVYSW